jgi:hypothetical protein
VLELNRRKEMYENLHIFFFLTKTTTLHPADMPANDFKLQEFYKDDWKHFLTSVFITTDFL